MTGPTDLVAERIRRANPSIGREAARELAAELDDIIACALKRWRAAPHFGVVEVDEVDVAFDDADGNDLIQTMTYAIIDDKDLSASELEHLDYMLSVLESVSDDSRDLYLRYTRLSEQINGTDLVGRFKLDPRAKKSRLVLVRNDNSPVSFPVLHPYGHIVYQANRGDVHTVLVNGKVVKYEHKLVGVDLANAKAAIESTIDYLKGEHGPEEWNKGMHPEIPEHETLNNPYTYRDDVSAWKQSDAVWTEKEAE